MHNKNFIQEHIMCALRQSSCPSELHSCGPYRPAHSLYLGALHTTTTATATAATTTTTTTNITTTTTTTTNNNDDNNNIKVSNPITVLDRA